MALFQNLPLRRKLTVLSMLISGVALVLACGAFIAYEQVSFRRSMTRELDITAQIIGANSASSLSFEDNDSATLTLKSLAAQPQIVAGCVYDAEGKVFATYRRGPDAGRIWPAPRPDQVDMDEDSLELFRSIRFAGETIGTIYLHSDLQELHQRWRRYIAIAGGVLVAAMFIAWLLASRLQRAISEPIVQLAAIAGRVGAEKDYSVRAVRRGDDEIGHLIDGFNEMLAQIQERDADLQASRDALERRVEERTRSLRQAQQETEEERARFQFIFDHVPVGISLQSWRGDVRQAHLINEAHLRICGLTREEAMQPEIFQKISHPEDYARQAALRAQSERGEIDSYSLEKRYVRPDGEIVWVVFSTQRKVYPDGRAESLSSVVDITSLKKAEEEITRERERFKFIFDSMPVGVTLYSTAPNGELVFLLNDAQLRITGATREQAMNDRNLFNRLTHPEDYPRQLPLRLQLRAGEIDHYTIDKRYVRPDGRTVWVAFSTQRKIYPDGREETLSTAVDITGLKQAQEEAAREQARLKFIFDSVPVGISLYSGNSDNLKRSFLINNAHLDICGVTREEAATDGDVFSRLTHPDDAARQAPLNAALIAGKLGRYSLEKRYLRPDGRTVWVVFSAQRKDYPDGRVETLGTVVDITELKQVQEEVTRERARFKFIFDSLPVGVSWRLLGKGQGILVNSAHERITGISAAASVEPGIFATVSHPDDRPRQQELVDRFNRGEIDHYVMEKRYLHPGGKVVWVVLMSRMSVDPESGERQAVTTLVDISDLKRAQEEIARERARFKLIFDSLPVGVAWMVQGQSQTRIVNPSFVRITGVPAEFCHEFWRYLEVTHPDDRAPQHALYEKLKAGETDQMSLEKRYRHEDGSLCWTTFTLRLVRDPGSDEIQELTTLVDITERKRAQAELEDMHKQLIQTSHQAGMAEVATGVLHNVGNVLNSVNVSATLVTDLVRRSKAPNVGKISDLLAQHRSELGPYLVEDAKGRMIPSYLATLAESLAAEQKAIITELESLHKNIDHIKDIVAMQQSYAKTSGVTETVSVPDLVEDALRMNAGSLARHDVDVARDYAGRPVITTEKNKVLQILVNLIRNAKYACDESGRTDKLIILRTTTEERGVSISVIDNGVGIPAENLTRIFAHGFTTRKHGHGFGLHSGALAAREIGGSLTVRSEGPGKGATFTLRLPFSPESVS